MESNVFKLRTPRCIKCSSDQILNEHLNITVSMIDNGRYPLDRHKRAVFERSKYTCRLLEPKGGDLVSSMLGYVCVFKSEKYGSFFGIRCMKITRRLQITKIRNTTNTKIGHFDKRHLDNE